MRALRLFCPIVIAILALPLLAQQASAPLPIPIDLAFQEEGSTRVEPIGIGVPFTVVIENRVPTGYTVTIERRPIPIPALAQFPVRAPGANPCDDLVANFEAALTRATNEIQVATAVRNARTAADSCPAIKQAELEVAIKDATIAEVGRYDGLQGGEEFIVTVSRGAGSDAKKWILNITTGAAGVWRITYGFNFVPDRDERYFLEPRDDGQFDITPERDDNDFAFVPAIFASWLSRRQQYRGFGWGVSAGLGFESEKPIVFAGPTFTYRENVSLNLGVVMQQRQRLNPQLDPDKPVSQNFSAEQLHTNDGYRPNWFIGIGFRFDSNPFKGGREETGEEVDDENDDGGAP